ncbi:hypothetical protein LIV57_01115 [Chryseobacterium sp. X308]|uniref:hypothetical protein n=1 Tax=Chryseobacterium sp. X308 TaxID=2884873 RepID=UPI001D13C755|nr:hypothetical protein [Chryseobacterium sp. X308]MCC3213848.1 hypothetical protein [Chryseobacterium sp. X308]
MKKIYLGALLCTGLSISYAQQTEVYFKYDESGSQRYRGSEDIAGKSATQLKSASLSKNQLIDEKTFWKQIRLYPVPVNDILTIDWTEQTDTLIESVSLYQHSTVHWKFQQKNMPGLNRQLKINMTGYDWGVYILRFTLKDGRIFSKNITKR